MRHTRLYDKAYGSREGFRQTSLFKDGPVNGECLFCGSGRGGFNGTEDMISTTRRGNLCADDIDGQRSARFARSAFSYIRKPCSAPGGCFIVQGGDFIATTH